MTAKAAFEPHRIDREQLKPLSTAQKVVKEFQARGIKCRIDASGLGEDITRRGFLQGAGAAAVAGAAGGANAEQLNIEPLMTSTDGTVSIVFVSRPGKSVNGWLALKKRNGKWSPVSNDTAGGIKIDGGKVITVGFDFVNTNPRIGRDEAGAPDYTLANMNGIDYIHPIKTASKQILNAALAPSGFLSLIRYRGPPPIPIIS